MSGLRPYETYNTKATPEMITLVSACRTKYWTGRALDPPPQGLVRALPRVVQPSSARATDVRRMAKRIHSLGAHFPLPLDPQPVVSRAPWRLLPQKLHTAAYMPLPTDNQPAKLADEQPGHGTVDILALACVLTSVCKKFA
ncbi:hypothetical protein CBL_01996 [Carabus blaptoides fortunei]